MGSSTWSAGCKKSEKNVCLAVSVAIGHMVWENFVSFDNDLMFVWGKTCENCFSPFIFRETDI